MKKSILVLFCVTCFFSVKAQNLIRNPGFEQHINNGFGCTLGSSIGFSNIFDTITPNDCGIKDWIRISETPDAYWNKGHDFPTNWLSNYVYPHSDSVCVGVAFYIQSMPNVREIIQGKLTKPLIADHHYQFSIYVQLFDTMRITNPGKLVGINSFSALFTDTIITSVTDLPIQNYHPQIQIDSMVIDTQHWVLLMDTFMAKGGEQFVSIGNFKQDGQFQSKVVQTIIPNSARISYYYMDDVSLIDLDDTASGVEEQLAVGSNQLIVYPNPASESIVIETTNGLLNGKLQIFNYMGVLVDEIQLKNKNKLILNTKQYLDGLYLFKITDNNSIVSEGKFNIVK